MGLIVFFFSLWPQRPLSLWFLTLLKWGKFWEAGRHLPIRRAITAWHKSVTPACSAFWESKQHSHGVHKITLENHFFSDEVNPRFTFIVRNSFWRRGVNLYDICSWYYEILPKKILTKEGVIKWFFISQVNFHNHKIILAKIYDDKESWLPLPKDSSRFHSLKNT